MQGSNAMLGKFLHYDLQAADTLIHHQVFTLHYLVAHDPHHFGTKCFHTRNRPIHLVQGNGKIIPHILPPVGNGRTEGIDIHSCLIQGSAELIKLRVRDIMKVFTIQTSRLNRIPSQFLGGGDLNISILRGLVSNSCKVHNFFFVLNYWERMTFSPPALADW